MLRSSTFQPYQQAAQTGRRPSTHAAQGAADFLRAHDKMASLLPTIARMGALQKDCSAILPEMFNSFEVLQCESEQLTLAIPNASLAAKLKQRLPKLQEALLKRGWQVSAIRLKVQVGKNVEKSTPSKQLHLPEQALSALSTLRHTLDNTPRNAALNAAIQTMLNRHHDAKQR